VRKSVNISRPGTQAVLQRMWASLNLVIRDTEGMATRPPLIIVGTMTDAMLIIRIGPSSVHCVAASRSDEAVRADDVVPIATSAARMLAVLTPESVRRSFNHAPHCWDMKGIERR
jgi:hypothetical protein